MKWSVQQGGWVTLPFTLSMRRYGSSSWARGDTMVIMGGEDDAGWTSETVSIGGDNTRSSFPMKYRTR